MSGEDPTVKWIPLELWRASSLAQETQAVTFRYDRVLKSGDAASLELLRASIEQRIDDIENFYVQHVDDERGVLFEKQRLKLRKLLHSHDAAGAAGAGAGAAGGAARLNLTELMAWFLRDGQKELRGVSEDGIATFFNSLAPSSPDGKVTLVQVRQWYKNKYESGGGGGTGAGSGGSGAEDGGGAAEAAGGSAGEGGSGDDRAGSATDSKGSPVKYPGFKGFRGGGAGVIVRKQKPKKKKAPKKAVYAWEKAAAAAETGAEEDEEEPVGLQGMLEFQVRMTADEYRELCLRRRNKAAEMKHFKRSDTDTKRKAAIQLKEESVTLSVGGAYVEPTTYATNIYRSSDKDKWITQGGFNTHAITGVGSSPTRVVASPY